MNTAYGIGLDIGIASVGWAVVALNEDAEPYGLIMCGTAFTIRTSFREGGASA